MMSQTLSLEKISGRAWKFGDNISTDHIAPGRYFHLRTDLQQLAKHVLEDARNDFASRVQKGDIVVAGQNFGLGSSREHAPTIIKLAGVSAVLAKSFARIFYRNAISIGLPVIICDVNKIQEGDKLEISLRDGKIVNATRGETINFHPLPQAMMRILAEGGIINYIKKVGDLTLE